ncbi:hypothetical protein LEP1GSC158_2105 [Leptospira interrogans serovar Zanoni str. LT2156]|uniref:Uncharacterized protein n=1 Tax=Leptospira interrogans serovar Zanoni str. LT2156 TaxID=1001601 RepID=M6HD79_LEPIR|nr:hypothetical protein LEP1GSC158_2105 [Leptospira interrogans serovar Zanoni str. LT2156]
MLVQPLQSISQTNWEENKLEPWLINCDQIRTCVLSQHSQSEDEHVRTHHPESSTFTNSLDD